MARRGRYLEARLLVAGGSLALLTAGWAAVAVHDLQHRSEAASATGSSQTPASAQPQVDSRPASVSPSGAVHTRSRAS